MSMTLIALVDSSYSITTGDLGNYARELGLPLAFEHEADLKTHTGFLPAKVKEFETGVETYFDEAPDFLDQLPPNQAIDGKHFAALSFRWGGNFKEGATAWYIAHILSAQCQAVLFETWSGEYVTADYAMEGGKAMLEME